MSSIEKIMIDQCLKRYIPDFMEIGPLVPENKVFDIYGCGGHLWFKWPCGF